jgi:hypothetical protein
MPRSPLAGHELDQLSVTANEEMAGHLEATQTRLQKRSTTPVPPNSPGGKLMLCTTSRQTAAPSGRSSWLGELICSARSKRPSASKAGAGESVARPGTKGRRLITEPTRPLNRFED